MYSYAFYLQNKQLSYSIENDFEKEGTMSKTITIHDVAKAVGASTATVSKALNGRKDVSAEMRDKVLKTAMELGYRPNVSARGLKMKKSWLVGILYGFGMLSTLEHPLFLPIMDAFKRRMEQYGYELLFLSGASNFVGNDLLTHMSVRHLDGVLLMDPHPTMVEKLISLPKRFPMVCCDGIIPSITSVLTDNHAAAWEAVQYLHQCGHENIGHIAGPSGVIATAGQERLEGFKSAMEHFGLPCDDSHVVAAKEWTYGAGREAFIELMDRNPNLTAIFCAADFYLMGVTGVCRERAISIPEDLSVVGFDDMEWTRYIDPGFTTFRQDKETLGIRSAEALVQCMEHEVESEIIRIPSPLITRNSVGQPKY